MSEQDRWQGLLRGSVLSVTTQKFHGFVGIGDRKAMGVILLNSILIPIIAPYILSPIYGPSILITLLIAVASIFLAIISIFPRSSYGEAKNRENLLHFGSISKLTQEEYLEKFRPIYNDPERLSQIVLEDLHFTSKYILAPKFKWVKLSYITFFVGNLLSLIVFLLNIWI